MSLLLQALQKAARNREGPASETGTPLELEPTDSGAYAPAPAERMRSDDLSPPPKRVMSAAAAAAILSASEPSGPTLADYVRERPMAAIMLLALIFAAGYGFYLYIQIFHPQWLRGEFSRPQAILASTPPPTALPPPRQIDTAPASQPYSSLPAQDPYAAGQAASTSAATAAQPNSELASLMNLPPSPPPAANKQADPNSRLSALGDALNAPSGVTEKRAKNTIEEPPVHPRPVEKQPAPARTVVKEPVPPRAAPPRPALANRAGPKPASAPALPVMELNDQVIVNAAPGVAAPAGPTTADAYRAWKSGKLDEARVIYRELLEHDERNVDALLGAAGVAQQQGNSQEALNYYGRVIETEPRNSAAQAGIIAIAGQADPSASEARLKQLLAREPSGFLHFSLGNLYARQNQWSQAQQSYFQAYQMDADNSDYAYNLAVGLEHVGQAKLAITYYRKALDLSMKQGRATFNQEQVIDRIAKLSRRAN
ncbi:MAG: tetratricopeptide repeat protein [Burkholderiales bacterium]